MDFIDSEAETDSGALVNQTNFEMIRTIESQNARIVKLLGRVADTRDKIRQSEQFVVQVASKQKK